MRIRAVLPLLMACLLPTAQTCAQVGGSPLVIGYYAGDGRDVPMRSMDQLTHVIWCFGHLRNDSFIVADKQVKVLRDLVGAKRANPKLKVLVSLGGWGGCEPCSETFSRAEGRATFARSVKALLKRTWTDGIDLDWEYPAVQGFPGHPYADADRHNFTLLVRELRRELGEGYEITFAAGGTDECLVKGFEWDSVMAVADRVHVMSYDLVHGFSTRTGHHTPLHATPAQSASAERAVHLLDSLGVPRRKVVIGGAFYARVFKEVDATGNGLHRPGVFSTYMRYSVLDTAITPARGWALHRDAKAGAPYAYRATTREFATFDDATSLAGKARYVRREGLGGLMFWQLGEDKLRNGLLQAIHDALQAP